VGDEAIHRGHCTRARCAYGDPQCPVDMGEFTGEPGRAERALAVLREEEGLRYEWCVRSKSEDWVYALPRIIPKALYGKRGTLEAAQWHLTKIAGHDPEDHKHFEIVRRLVGDWQVVE